MLHFGFKSSRAAGFQKKQLYVWDMIEKCIEETPRPLMETDPSSDEDENETGTTVKEEGSGSGNAGLQKNLTGLVAKINLFPRIGKHEKVNIYTRLQEYFVSTTL